MQKIQHCERMIKRALYGYGKSFTLALYIFLLNIKRASCFSSSVELYAINLLKPVYFSPHFIFTYIHVIWHQRMKAWYAI